jgi:hypothetical protein
MLTHPENSKSRNIYSIKKKLQNNYETLWKINLNKCEKLKCESLLLLTPTFLLLLNKQQFQKHIRVQV